MSRLEITRVTLQQFGGTRGAPSIEIPSSGLVVLEGPNESGKSTLMEAIAWLLAEPTADSAAVARMGSRHDVLEARIDGNVGDKPFSVDAKFKIQARDKAKRDADTVVVDGRESTIEAFHRRIGLTDPSLFHSVFRVEGADGHRADAVERLMATAGAGVFTGPDPRDIAERFRWEAKTTGTSAAAGADSVRKRTRQIRELESDLAEQGTRVAAYREALDSERRNDEKSVEIRARQNDLLARRAAFDLASTVVTNRTEAARTRKRCDELPTVPDEWVTVVERIDELRDVGERLADDGPELRSKVERGVSAAGRQKRSLDELAAITIPDEVTGQLAELADTATRARDDVERLARDVAEAERALDAATKVATDDLAVLRDATPHPVSDPTTVDFDGKVPLIALAEKVRASEQLLTQAVDRAGEAAGRLEDAERLASQRQSMFDSLGSGLSVDEVIAGQGATGPARSGGPTGLLRWFAPAAFIVFAGALAATKRYIAAAAAAGLAMVSALLTGLEGKKGAAAPSTGTGARLRDAALDVHDARRELPTLQAARADAERTRESAHADLGRRSAELARALAAAGLPGDTPYRDVERLLEVWSAAADATNIWRQWTVELDRRRSDLELAQRDSDLAGRRLAEAVARFGIPVGSGPEVSVALAGLRDDARAAGESVSAARTLRDLEQRLAEILSPVGLVADDARSAIRAAEQHAEVLDARGAFLAEADELEREAERALNTSPVVRELVEGHPDIVLLRGRQAEMEDELEELQSRYHDVVQAAADARAAMDALLDVDHVSSIEEQISAADAAANDLAVDAVSAAIAHLLMVEEVAKEEQERQPALVSRTSEIATAVAATWDDVRAVRAEDGSGGFDLEVRQANGSVVPAHQLSTGGRIALYLALRVAVADDRTVDGVALPLLCDDPLVNIDADRAAEVMRVLAEAAGSRQVIVTTCHRSTSILAEKLGGTVVPLVSDI